MKRTKGFISIFFKGQGMRKAFTSLIFAVSLVVFLSLSGTASGATLYVPSVAYGDIQSAIDAAIYGDTIIVRNGTYTGANNKNLYLEGKSITLKSENGPQNCIIDCQGSGRGFFIRGGSPVVDGFTIKNGYITGGGEPRGWGGGILCWSASPTITNCIITNNYSNERGGGIYLYYASPTITNCVINGNRAIYYGGGIDGYRSTPTIINCMIIGNKTLGYGSKGGGIRLNNAGHPVIKNCTISGNLATTYGNKGGGGGIFTKDTSLIITNCVIWGNSAYYGPEIEHIHGGAPTIQYTNIDRAKIRGIVNWGDGNINADPLFVGGGDYHLTEFSPCVDVGTDAGVDTDIDGDARPYDVPNWKKDGTGDEFDMGADEFAPPLLNEPPIAVCKDIEIDVDEACQASIIAEDVDGGSYDPDEGDTITLSIDNKGPFSLGKHTVNLTVTDENEASDTCQATVTVVDTIPPIPDVPALPTVTGECSVTITSTATATDNCAGPIPGTTSDSLEYTVQGTYTVTWTYDDGNGNTTTQTQSVIVEDTTPPEIISVSVSPNILWPPNHKMVLITPDIMVSDNCDLDPKPEAVLTSITTNEGDETNAYDAIYDSTLGDGHTTNDIQVDDGKIYLRAERSAKGTGRIYTITYTVIDASGNSATTTTTVTVPNNQK